MTKVKATGANEATGTLIKATTQERWEVPVSKMLLDIGMDPSLIGFGFARQALLMGIENYEIVYAMTKRVYPEIAKYNNTKPERVERNIRHAVGMCIKHAKPEALDKYFGNIALYKVTNSMFISVMLEYVKNHRKEIESL